jgi:hypothetical protein
MTNLDDAIHGALTEEDKEFLAKFEEEPTSLAQAFGVFQGRLGWLYIAILVVAVIFAPIGLFSAWQFLTATEMRPLFYWGAATAGVLLILSVVRVVFFMQLNTNRILRELKRLELQLARLAAKMN